MIDPSRSDEPVVEISIHCGLFHAFTSHTTMPGQPLHKVEIGEVLPAAAYVHH